MRQAVDPENQKYWDERDVVDLDQIAASGEEREGGEILGDGLEEKEDAIDENRVRHQGYRHFLTCLFVEQFLAASWRLGIGQKLLLVFVTHLLLR
jgi:hypothetical protein